MGRSFTSYIGAFCLSFTSQGGIFSLMGGSSAKTAPPRVGHPQGGGPTAPPRIGHNVTM